MKHEIYIFGSVIRGEVGASSDIDVLVIPLDGQGKEGYPSNWSYYKEDSLLRLHQEGRLFAWHLFLESICIYTHRDIPIIKEWGAPRNYSTASKDIDDLEVLLKAALIELRDGTPSTIYEVGIIYTCLRDIATSASWHLLDKPSFSRMVPYLLPVPFPLVPEDYRGAMIARHASTRGTWETCDFELVRHRLLAAPLDEWVFSIKESIR